MKHKVKDYIKAFLHCWEQLLYIFLIVCFMWAVFEYRVWLADGDFKCALAQDPATCAAAKSNN